MSEISEKPSLLMSAGQALMPQWMSGAVPAEFSTAVLNPSQSGSLAAMSQGGRFCAGLYQVGQLSGPATIGPAPSGSPGPSETLSASQSGLVGQMSGPATIGPAPSGSARPSEMLSASQSGLVGQGSHSLPEPSRSPSCWKGLYTSGQLSSRSTHVSASGSSQASPAVVAGCTTFAWVGLEAIGQLSEPEQSVGEDLPGSQTPSRS